MILNLENNGLLEISYYQNVSYFIIESDGDYQDVKLRVGEAVETTLHTDWQPAFGVVKGIIKHTWNDGHDYVFIYLDWLGDLKKCDDLLQHTYNNSWDGIHPISIVSRSPNVPFVHNCKSRCLLQQHDFTNREYLRNDFFYTAIIK
ncbi:hypothetical protein RclHR1_02190002 [Rhizophagus clarus]|uniref:Uncharacterized protein n=1 Tax=Rhizophagus clarus TaxID=94130 RepID=A0A2Z6QTM2_9GLOM|nr:hypothetical protein RclHR1_02190002 [Rhizophagus clarus]